MEWFVFLKCQDSDCGPQASSLIRQSVNFKVDPLCTFVKGKSGDCQTHRIYGSLRLQLKAQMLDKCKNISKSLDAVQGVISI